MKAFFFAFLFFLVASVASATTSLSISWRANNDTSAMTGFKLERAPAGPVNYVTWTVIATLSPTTKRYTDTNLEHNKMYQYRVRAYNSNGNGPASNVIAKVTRRT